MQKQLAKTKKQKTHKLKSGQLVLFCGLSGQILWVHGDKNVFGCSHQKIYLQNFANLLTEESKQMLPSQLMPENLNTTQFQADFFARKKVRGLIKQFTQTLKVQCYRCFTKLEESRLDQRDIMVSQLPPDYEFFFKNENQVEIIVVYLSAQKKNESKSLNNQLQDDFEMMAETPAATQNAVAPELSINENEMYFSDSSQKCKKSQI